MSENQQPRKSVLRRFTSNLAAILTSDVLNRGTTFLIYILVARELGTYAFGQMTLALTLFYSFQVVASFGMQTLITREVAKDENTSAKYFASSLLVALVASVGATILMFAAVILLDYPIDTRDAILISGLGLVPFAMSTICEAIIRGWEKMHWIAFVQVPVNVLKVLATCYLVWNGGDILQVLIVIVGARALIAICLLAITIANVGPWRSEFGDLSFAKSIVKRSTTFVGIDTVTAWWTSLNIVLLSKLTSESDVGLYNAAIQLMIPLGIFYQSVMVAAFPIMCRKFQAADNGLKRVSNRLIELLMIMAIPGTIGLAMIAEPALEFVFKEDKFVDAAIVVRILAFILILKALTFALGHILLAGSKETTTLRIVVVNLLFNLVIGLILIHYFGLVGAAVAGLFTRIVDFAQHYRPVREVVARLEIWSTIWKPVVAGGVMTIHLFLFSNQYLPILIASAIVVYFAVLLAIEALMAGGFRNLRAQYF